MIAICLVLPCAVIATWPLGLSYRGIGSGSTVRGLGSTRLGQTRPTAGADGAEPGKDCAS